MALPVYTAANSNSVSKKISRIALILNDGSMIKSHSQQDDVVLNRMSIFIFIKNNLDVAPDVQSCLLGNVTKFDDEMDCISIIKFNVDRLSKKSNTKYSANFLFLFNVSTAVYKDKIKLCTEANVDLSNRLSLQFNAKPAASYNNVVKKSGAVNAYRHTLVVKPKSANFTDNTASLLKHKVDPIKERIKITGFRTVNNTVFVNFSNQNQLENFKTKVEKSCNELAVEFPKKKLPRVIFKYYSNQFDGRESYFCFVPTEQHQLIDHQNHFALVQLI